MKRLARIAALAFALCVGCGAKPPNPAPAPIADNGMRAYLVTHGSYFSREAYDVIPEGVDTLFSVAPPGQWRYSFGYLWSGVDIFARYPVTVTNLCGDTLWTLAETQAKAEADRLRERAEAVRRSLEDCK